MSTSTLHLGIFYMPQIYDMGPTALLPLRRKAWWGFFLPLKIRRLRPGLNPRTWVLKASTLPLDHRSRMRYIYIYIILFHSKISSYVPKWFRIDNSDVVRMDNISFERRYQTYVPDHGRWSMLTYFFILNSYLTQNTVCLNYKRKWMLSSALDFAANLTETAV